MADSKRQRIVDAVVARMQTILIANGYATDIGSTVEDWRVNWQDDELPAISICDLTAEAANTNEANPRYTLWQMPLQIRVYAKKGTDAANIREMLKDVQRAIRQDDRWLVSGIGLAMNTLPLRDGFIIPDDSFEVVGGIVEVEVQFKTNKFDGEA